MKASLAPLVSVGRSRAFRGLFTPHPASAKALSLLLASPRGEFRLAPKAINRRAASKAAKRRASEAFSLAMSAAAQDRSGLAEALAALALEDLGRDAEAAAWYRRAAAKAPKEGWLRLARAEALRRAGDLDGFVAEATAAHYLDEGAGSLRFAVADPRRQTPQDAVAGCTALLRRRPKAAWALALRGDLKRFPELSDFPGAVDDLRGAVRLKPSEAWFHAHLSRALLSLGDAPGALASVRRAAALRPACGWIHAWHGELLRRLGRPAEAKAALDRALRLDPGYELAWAWRGGAHRLLGRPARAESDLRRAAALDPAHAWTFAELSLTLRARGKTAAALEAVETARRLDPKSEFCARPDAPAAARQLERHLKTAPRDARAWLWLGRCRLLARDASGAQAALSRARALDRRSALAALSHAEALSALGRSGDALKAASAAVRLAPGDGAALGRKGELLLASGRARSALPVLRAAALAEPRAAWVQEARAWAALQAGRPAEAKEAFARARRLAPGELERRLGRLSREGAHAQALDLASRAVQLEPSRPMLAALAEAFRSLGHHEQAVAAHDALVRLEGGGAESRLSRGAALRAARRYEEALADARACVRGRPVAARLLEAECLRNLGREAEAERAAAAACRLEPGRAWAWVVRGKAVLQAGEAKAAAALFARATRLEPGDGKAWGWLAWAELARGRGSAALAFARKGRKASPGVSWLIAAEAEALRARRDFGGARALMHEALRLDPRCSCAFDVLGAARPTPRTAWALAWDGAARSSVPLLDRALALEPELSWARALRGAARLAAGDADGAAFDLDAALALDPGDAQARAWLAAARG